LKNPAYQQINQQEIIGNTIYLFATNTQVKIDEVSLGESILWGKDMAKTMCPGQDTTFWKPGDIFEIPCVKCGFLVEFF